MESVSTPHPLEVSLAWARRQPIVQVSKLIIQQLRVRQWIKNGLIAFPLIFSDNLRSLPLLLRTVECFILFSLVASSVYIVNDLIDYRHDRLHPKKKLRPIASGAFPQPMAWLTAAILLSSSLWLADTLLGHVVFILLASYYCLNLLYSLVLKTIPPVDIIVVAVFFLLRPIIGAVAIGVTASNWMIITTFFAALYLVTLKRSSELENIRAGQAITRKNINTYSLALLNNLGLMSVTAALVSYAIYSSGFPHFFELTTVPLVGLAFRVVMLHEQQPHRFEAPRLIFSDTICLVFGLVWIIAALAYHWR